MKLGKPVASLLACGLAAVAVVTPTSPAVAAKPAPGSCSLATATITAQATPDAGLTGMFSRYGNTSGTWVGADSTYSVPLKDGSTAWLFSDTLYGQVQGNRLDPASSLFLNNSIVQQRGQQLITRTGGTPARPDALVPMDGTAWHWFGDGELKPNGQLQVGVLRFDRFGPGFWDWKWESNEVATIDTRSWRVLDVAPLPSSAGIQWASWYQSEKGATYVYGVEDLGSAKYMHVAKVLGNDLAKTHNWRYFDGQGWSKQESASVRVADGVSNEYSVAPFRDGYVLITHDTHEAFSSRIVARFGCSATGPFGNEVELYRTPETGALGSYQDPNVWTYNAHEHPELRTGNTLVISHNVNTFDANHVYDDVSIYRPRFIDVTLHVA